MAKTRKYIEFGALCLLAIGILWWFGRTLNWSEVRAAVSNANIYMLGTATLIISFAYLIRAFRWGAFLRPLGGSHLSHLFAATTIGFGAVFLAGRAGEVVRPVVLPMRDPTVRPSASFVTIVVERIYDLVAVVLMFAINLIWFRPPAGLQSDFNRVRLVGIALLTVAVVGVIALGWFRKHSNKVIDAFKTLFATWTFIPERLAKLVVGLLGQLAKALSVLVNVKELLETVFWTTLLWLGVALANLLVIRAFGVPFGFSETVFVLGWSMVASLVPTPGGAAGAFHAATAAGLLFLGVEKEIAAAISIVMHLIDFGPAVLFGFVYVIKGDLNFSRLRALTSQEAVEEVVENEVLIPEGTQDGQALEKTGGEAFQAPRLRGSTE
ncbi:MAG TPA: lysylphosphatidylglycerol synthase transmembrane domain-containing protein [Pyrinomonadaceae bacterium]|nr:lysylphosphatidylglycerol synthase transmembrane domain-containing protein [Pyrinomonadaceae bacterium]